MRSLPRWRGNQRARHIVSLLVIAVPLLLGFAIAVRNDTAFRHVENENQLVDLLAWLPATAQSQRGFAAWTSLPDAPLDVVSALDTLALEPRPLAIGRSADWQRATGISSSQVTGWSAAYELGASVLVGTFTQEEVEHHLRQQEYTKSTYRSVHIWHRFEPWLTVHTVDRDDHRSLSVIAVMPNRVVIGFTEAAVLAVLDAAAGETRSLAEEPLIDQLDLDGSSSGLMVMDQRDVAVECGVSGSWRRSDFADPSGLQLIIVYRQEPASRNPVTSIRTDFGVASLATDALPILATAFEDGFINQLTVGGRLADIAHVERVYADNQFVVAELTSGRDNGWVRSGVRFLSEICTQSSALIPAGLPIRATPIASPIQAEQQ